MIDLDNPERRKKGPFVPATAIRNSDGAVSHFAARHFAAKRAGFLLREYARQQASPSVEAISGGLVKPEVSSPEEITLIESATGLSPQPSIATGVAGVTEDELERRVAEAEQRGREVGQSELVLALDQAIAALDAAARAVSEAQTDLERRCVVPLAQAGFHLGGELARQVLGDAAGLQRYLDAVMSAIKPVQGESETPSVLLNVRMNPEDLALLERASFRPASFNLIADPLVPRAGVIVSADNKVIDDRFENRLRFAKEAALAAAADLLREAPS